LDDLGINFLLKIIVTEGHIDDVDLVFLDESQSIED